MTASKSSRARQARARQAQAQRSQANFGLGRLGCLSQIADTACVPRRSDQREEA